MEKSQVAAIAVIVLMVASVVAYTVFFTSPPQEQQQEEAPPLEQKPLALRFKANSVDASIIQLLPTIRVGASSTEFNINEIDKAVAAFSGVKSVRSQFSQPEQQELGTGFLYIADISFSNDVNRLELLSYLEGLPVLSNVDALSFALAGIPKKIKLVSEFDLNISRDHEFSDTVIEAFVRVDANTGDRIRLNLSVTISGNNVSEIIAHESINAGQEFEEKQATVSASIETLFPELLIEATIDSAELSDTNSFRQDFLKIADVNGVQLSLPPGFDPSEYVSKPLQIAAKLSLTKTSSKDAGDAAGKIMRQKSASFKVLQAGTISLLNFADDSNKTLEVPGGIVSVLFSSGHSVGDKAEIELAYIVYRNKIASIGGREK